MRNYVERAKDFIKEVFPYIEDDIFNPWELRMDIRKFNAEHSRAVQVASGCARVALITSDYVVKFEYDEYEVQSIGGCENEIYLYNLAKQEGFAYLFAEITPVEWAGRIFYVMPRIRGINERHERGWYYMTAEEQDWCEKHSLTDLHCGNFGFRKGRICIVDYGFQEDRVDAGCDSDSYETTEPQSYS